VNVHRRDPILTRRGQEQLAVASKIQRNKQIALPVQMAHMVLIVIVVRVELASHNVPFTDLAPMDYPVMGRAIVTWISPLVDLVGGKEMLVQIAILGISMVTDARPVQVL
jgi:hypothetical protein